MGASTDVGPPHVLNVRGGRPAAAYERFGVWEWLGFDRATREPLDADPGGLLGHVVLAFPRHVCPTVNQYGFALLVKDGGLAGEVAIDARDG
jgi:hypothetical protein